LTANTLAAAGTTWADSAAVRPLHPPSFAGWSGGALAVPIVGINDESHPRRLR